MEEMIIILVSLSHCLAHSLMLIFPSLMALIGEDMGIKFAKLGLFAFISQFLFGSISIPAGILADWLGSKRVIALAFWGAGLAAILISLSTSPMILAMGLALMGLFAGFYHPSGLALISRTIVKKGKALGFHGVAGTIGMAIAPPLASIIASIFNWRAPFILFAFLSFLLAYFLSNLKIEEKLYNTSNKDKPVSSPVQNQDHFPVKFILILFLSAVFYGLYHQGALIFMPLHFKTNLNFIQGKISSAGLFSGLVIAIGVLGQLLGGFMVDRAKRAELLYSISFLSSTIFLCGMHISSDVLMLIFSALLCTSIFSVQPTQNYLLSIYAHRGIHGLSYGILFTASFGVGAISSWLAGIITDKIGVAKVFPILSFFSFIPFLLALWLLIQRGKIAHR